VSGDLINGVERDRYGVWCAHGKHILVVDPADTGDYPGCVPADPWPCEDCTLADFIREQDEEAAAYDEERWRDARGM
jgi:hypothetical protein